MAEPIYLPKLGMTMEEGTLCRWIIADGGEVKLGELVFEMETEKVSLEVEAEHEGLLKQLVAEGAVLKPGDVVGAILATGEEVPQALIDRVAAQGGEAPGAGSQSTAATIEATLAEGEKAPSPATGGSVDTGEPPRVSPIARRLADENGIDVRTLTGSGPGGRIVERDVQLSIEAKAAAPAAQPSTVGAGLAVAPTAPVPAGTVPYTGRRRTIGERMHESASTVAAVTLTSEVQVDGALEMVHGLNREWRKDGVVVTLTALIVRACALALKEHPQLNSRLDGAQILLSTEVNVGVAVDQDAGLIVPVVRAADRQSLQMVAKSIRDLTEKARENRLGPDDLTGGTFTVSLLEGSGIDAFTPIINPPQAAILGVGRVREVAAFEGADVVKRQATTLSLTFDHRITDGAPAARFLDRVAELLSRPYLLM